MTKYRILPRKVPRVGKGTMMPIILDFCLFKVMFYGGPTIVNHHERIHHLGNMFFFVQASFIGGLGPGGLGFE